MVKHSYEVFKTDVHSYYKYKKDAYKKLKEVVATLLAETDYFEITGFTKDLRGFYFGNNLDKGVPGAVSLYHPNGSCVLSLEGTRVVSDFLGLRKYLTPKEHDLVSKCLAALFKHKGDRTIPGYLESRVCYWEINEDYCEFISYNGLRYFNKN